MNIIKLPQFTPVAATLWNKLSAENKRLLLSNAYCFTCKSTTTMINAKGKAEKGCVILNGQCCTCGNEVTRFVEGDWFHD